ncbi:adenosylcobinamide-phosphate synthase CbiB [Okeania sp. SIO1F9]|uniref:adenosylcobinamide-phosphate synthase CbiB n=1 Tax=Okeania sp. SIO1F9 TaxID=2607813 RepID=UPI00144CCDED|nr:adenosylcobinamide-phosphate synthase CbiB [Okeania sp. SIO1F9]NET75808.1 cobalamin biosynthesis protein [Okeania sp. SIO1F9]
MSANYTLIILFIAACLDYLIGDPWDWPHPVKFLGWIITHYTKQIFKLTKPYQDNSHVFILRLSGILLAIALVLGSGIISWLIIQALRINFTQFPLLTVIIESILLASCFAGKSLSMAAKEVLQLVRSDNLIQARQKLSMYVGRDTENLSISEIFRAIFETVTENATDGVIAPLFYALVGAIIPGVGSVPLAFAYKAASTLDSMVGYKEAPYTDIGWFSAKLEDVLTWLPCRLNVLTIALLSGKPLYVWRICQRDALKDPSPNAGWSECAYAATLGVQVGGTNLYKGVVKHKPLLGDPTYPITPEIIDRALQLTRYCFLIWLGLFFICYIMSGSIGIV